MRVQGSLNDWWSCAFLHVYCCWCVEAKASAYEALGSIVHIAAVTRSVEATGRASRNRAVAAFNNYDRVAFFGMLARWLLRIRYPTCLTVLVYWQTSCRSARLLANSYSSVTRWTFCSGDHVLFRVDSCVPSNSVRVDLFLATKTQITSSCKQFSACELEFVVRLHNYFVTVSTGRAARGSFPRHTK